MSRSADRHLLFGLLALQTGLVRQGQLVAAFHAWPADKARTIEDHLVAMGSLDEAQRAAIEALVSLQAQAHGGDVEQGPASITTSQSTREALASIAEPDIGAMLTRVGATTPSCEPPTVRAGIRPVKAQRRVGFAVGRWRGSRPSGKTGRSFWNRARLSFDL